MLPKRKIMKAETYGHIENGKIYLVNRAEFDQAVLKLGGDERVRIKFTCEKVNRKHTDPQRKYYFGVIVEILAGLIAESCGEKLAAKHREQAHEVLKLKCNPDQMISPSTGEAIEIPGTTTKQTTVEHNDYCERCRQWIFEFWGVVVPLPNEQAELFETKTK